MSYIEAIKKRKSTRNFNSEKKIPSSVKATIERTLKENSTNSFRFQWLSSDLQKVKLGTYGFIRGASNFLIGSTKDLSKESTIEFGKAFERVILKATKEGLNTCWMAGSYNLKDFSKSIDLQKGEQIVIVSPIGYASGERKMKDRFISLLSGSHKRKEWEALFFHKEEKTPLAQTIIPPYQIPLAMVRLAPSSNNGQPWRVIFDDDHFHFYFHPQLSASPLRSFSTGYNDLGIAMSHFELAAEELNLLGSWVDNDPNIHTKKLEYIRSWKVRKE